MKLNLACSFCGRTDEQVQRLIAGPQVFICDQCVATCNTILAEHPPRCPHNEHHRAGARTTPLVAVFRRVVVG